MNANWFALISAASAAGGFLLSWVSFLLAMQKRRLKEDREQNAVILELSHVREGISEIKESVKELGKTVSAMESQIVRIEERDVQTEKRMDRFDSRISHGHDGAVS